MFGIGDVVKKRREARDWTIEDLVKATEIDKRTIDKNTISDLETGKTKDPRQRTLDRIAAALGTTVSELRKEADSLASVTRVTTDDAEVIQDATNTDEGSLVDPRRPVQSGESTPQEGAPMIEDPFGRAVINLMGSFTTRDQFVKLHDAATALAKGGRNHAPKEGLPT